MDVDTMTNVILNNQYDLHEDDNTIEKAEEIEKPKIKVKKKSKIKTIIKLFAILLILGIAFVFVFFKTNVFQKYKELWVQTAMTTMSHQYLATWFLSDEEIAEIMNRLEVVNNENSNSNNIVIKENKKEITVEKITGKGYVGYVMLVPDASKVKLVDSRLSRQRF